MADNPSYPISTAAISWMDGNGQVHLRVYSCDGYKVTEKCFDGSAGWTQGALTAPASAVSATCWDAGGDVSIRVYCTFEDKTTEYCGHPDGSWVPGAVFT